MAALTSSRYLRVTVEFCIEFLPFLQWWQTSAWYGWVQDTGPKRFLTSSSLEAKGIFFYASIRSHWFLPGSLWPEYFLHCHPNQQLQMWDSYSRRVLGLTREVCVFWPAAPGFISTPAPQRGIAPVFDLARNPSVLFVSIRCRLWKRVHSWVLSYFLCPRVSILNRFASLLSDFRNWLTF